MGDILSTPSQSNPSTPKHTMSSSSNPPQTHQRKHEIEPAQQPEKPESKTPDSITDANIQESPAAAEEPIKDGGGGEGEGEGEEGEEEEGECGFCLFMKGGGCKDTFVEWEKCVEEGEKNKEDIVEKCFQATAALKKCMEAHSDYYAPLLAAEKAAEEEAARQLEEGRENLSDQEGKVESSGDSEHNDKSS